MSKFKADYFMYDGEEVAAVSKEKYTQEQALEAAKELLTQSIQKPTPAQAVQIAKERLKTGKVQQRTQFFAVRDAYAHYTGGCWRVDFKPHERSCPCWAIRITREPISPEWEYIAIN